MLHSLRVPTHGRTGHGPELPCMRCVRALTMASSWVSCKLRICTVDKVNFVIHNPCLRCLQSLVFPILLKRKHCSNSAAPMLNAMPCILSWYLPPNFPEYSLSIVSIWRSCLGWFVAWYVPTTWAATDPDTVRRSGYLSMLEGRMGHIRTKEEHAAYLADLAAKKKWRVSWRGN